ncbi:predicted protein [Histoplasma capsulatum var. duboisii H88]|uniref:Predicted protein n=1 Tax=Ajellomyces capsulatus (strain H88) TaxID=544711 RepID=F0UFA9_AJEC8|nr:predicted protein [Histoplasma capsulatum var. duboisii H88]
MRMKQHKAGTQQQDTLYLWYANVVTSPPLGLFLTLALEDGKELTRRDKSEVYVRKNVASQKRGRVDACRTAAASATAVNVGMKIWGCVLESNARLFWAIQKMSGTVIALNVDTCGIVVP